MIINDDEPLTRDNFLLYCAKHYDGRFCSSTEDFYADLNRIKYIKKLLTRYEQSKILKERLILNHIIVLNNVFGPEATARILYFKLRSQFHLVKPFLLLLSILPKYMHNINGEYLIDTDLLETDEYIQQRLDEI